MFSVQKVTKSFAARTECIRRSYEYWLPAALLAVPGSSIGRDERLALLQAAWAAYGGSHAFHNFTRRRLYRDSAQKYHKKGRGAPARQLAGGTDASDESEDADEEEVEEPYGAGGSSSDAALDGASDSANVEEAAAAAPGSARGSGEWGGRGHVRLVWKGEIDQADAVGRRHFRFMESCECSGIMELVPGGEPCVRLSVRGASFMLHQIRWVPYLLLLPALVSPI